MDHKLFSETEKKLLPFGSSSGNTNDIKCFNFLERIRALHHLSNNDLNSNSMSFTRRFHQHLILRPIVQQIYQYFSDVPLKC